MVPFSPTSLQNEDIRQYRAESIFHPKAYDAFAAPPFHTGNVGNRWENGQTLLYSGRGETYYDQIVPPHTSCFTSVAPLDPPTHFFVPARMEESFEIPHACAQQTYSDAALQDMKCERFGLSNYCFNYGGDCPMQLTSRNIVDLDLSSGASRRVVSPNSTNSGSETGSVGFATDEQHSSLPVENFSSAESGIQPVAIYHSQNDSFLGRPSKKSSATTEKDLERRRKNNEASRKSRAQRKDRFLMDVREVEFLKTENQRLKDLLTELELVIKEANDTLIAKFKYQLPRAPSPIL